MPPSIPLTKKRARATTTTTTNATPTTKKRKTATAAAAAAVDPSQLPSAYYASSMPTSDPYAYTPPPTQTRARPTSRKKKPTTTATTTGVYALPPSQTPGKSKKVSRTAAVATNAAPAAAPPEKRAARFKPHCPQNILERVDRVMTQRFFMIDRTRIGGALEEEFKVLGSTGNVYTVVIAQTPSCSCPDATKGNHCKHILFVFLKVLQVSQSSNVWYQKALLTSELSSIFTSAPLAPNSVQHPRIRAAYKRAMGKSTSSSSDVIDLTLEGDDEPDMDLENSSTQTRKRKTLKEEDDCPICYDGMNGMKEPKVVWCDECGNAVHKECFEQWKRTARTSGKQLTCVYCRAQIQEPLGEPSASSLGSQSTSRGGYGASEVWAAYSMRYARGG
ncbi:hypothetical protein BDN72DRAFT_890276 [Pluteus cervinus]|uniref:Uncharacterized protein n=1 Tax=Pluteus cervinus TaxID=181527 RepID=A0ACD3A5V8_9AGAR|nr:hypothetical protein BDN72DRAFT_890276 [Pluteus cervinus]